MSAGTVTFRPDSERAREGDVLLIAGKGRLWTHILAGAEVLLGRDASCDVVIDDPVMSRRHARLVLGPPMTIEDLGSHNGTTIGGQIHRGGWPVEIHPASGFSIGPYAFIVMSRAIHASTQRATIEQLVVTDPTTRDPGSLLAEVARQNINVLILGESGVGKEVLASTIHALSERAGPLQRINCAALPEALLEGELFGHERGAFTGATVQRVGLLESASGGTVFLDEIGELPLGIQAKLLRAIEAREIMRLGANRATTIDVRFVFATNRELAVEVAEKRFRHDLYFRIDGITLRIPPLRERPALIARLALELLGEDARGVAPEVLGALQAHRWPGNVRELKAVLERARLLARGGPIQLRHLNFSTAAAPQAAASPTVAPVASGGRAPVDLTDAQREEREMLLAALDACAGNQTRAAEKLGMSRTTFVTKMRVYRIPRPRS